MPWLQSENADETEYLLCHSTCSLCLFQARKMIGDFGIPLALIVMVCLDITVSTTVYTQVRLVGS